MKQAVLEARNICKSYGPVPILEDVSIEAHAGRVLVLLGDNGAGKSTLIKILSGVTAPSAGALLMDGQPVSFQTPRDARQRGIATVFQDLAVCNLLSITRNVVLGREPMKRFGPFRWMDMKKAEEQTRQAFAVLGVNVGSDMGRPAAALSGGQRQSLAIARAMLFGSTCLILDEPTSALAVRQAHGVLDQIKAAAAAGQAVIFITHNFHHALLVGDEVVVLGNGKVMAHFNTGETSLEELTRLVSMLH
ncbi:ATP-binding cassette domain-containing protein [Verminephrobacter eiseniae]|uniref:ATP-binding cassette domain-containing protein n=1 Tax=Verminephrobacter eiseniae TaxID=364317 RepID=UPI0010E7D20A|nr:ATP-binding cassette domain-containing protein [Verminephrobacter eiseniae]KAB7575745.1 sugar ABC transporter ATP-binding protein [Verminephrobacter sp. Larva24]MCW5232888.1 sugar ABC transporter ATP-binding protein [Verminephrobacter eiseniae]MCW5261054.1 sugar ABC transporter ATP-binding protein [Verminephrobacter eiseniae]MCW5295559.1 sugar ABC transporter ATP-binding protein [Verminephrobacter eiseniae]MCW8184484.1 sugar ABC transporter ATP-binding protein [Verminephrobacter eiseniae]